MAESGIHAVFIDSLLTLGVPTLEHNVDTTQDAELIPRV